MTLKVGDSAPDFTLKNQFMEEVKLSDFQGKKNVLFSFYPFSFTGTCTGELCGLRDDLSSFQNEKTELLAISCDSPFTQKVFAEKENFSFSVLSDFWPHGSVSKAYGAFVEDKGCANRASFIIGKDGKVAFALYNGFDARSNAEYTKVLATL